VSRTAKEITHVFSFCSCFLQRSLHVCGQQSMVMHWIPWMHCTTNAFSILRGNSSEHKWEQFTLSCLFQHVLDVKIGCHKRQTQKKEVRRHKFPTNRTKISKDSKMAQKDPKGSKRITMLGENNCCCSKKALDEGNSRKAANTTQFVKMSFCNVHSCESMLQGTMSYHF